MDRNDISLYPWIFVCSVPSVFRSYRENSNTRLSGFVHSWIKLRTSLYSAGVNCCLFTSIIRTTSIVFPFGVIVRVTLPKGLLITCSFVEVCNFMPSAGVIVYVTSSLIREGSSNKLERLLFKALMPQLSIPPVIAGRVQMANPFCASFLVTLTALFSLMIVGSADRRTVQREYLI